MREIEAYRCWDDHTWDTDMVEVPDDTPDDQLQAAVEHATLEAMRNSADLPVMVGVYHIPDPEEED